MRAATASSALIARIWLEPRVCAQRIEFKPGAGLEDLIRQWWRRRYAGGHLSQRRGRAARVPAHRHEVCQSARRCRAYCRAAALSSRDGRLVPWGGRDRSRAVYIYTWHRGFSVRQFQQYGRWRGSPAIANAKRQPSMRRCVDARPDLVPSSHAAAGGAVAAARTMRGAEWTRDLAPIESWTGIHGDIACSFQVPACLQRAATVRCPDARARSWNSWPCLRRPKIRLRIAAYSHRFGVARFALSALPAL